MKPFLGNFYIHLAIFIWSHWLRIIWLFWDVKVYFYIVQLRRFFHQNKVGCWKIQKEHNFGLNAAEKASNVEGRMSEGHTVQNFKFRRVGDWSIQNREHLVYAFLQKHILKFSNLNFIFQPNPNTNIKELSRRSLISGLTKLPIAAPQPATATQ